jgi:hypothetical protein
MKINYIRFISAVFVASLGWSAMSCQNMDKPVLGEYAKDANKPGGPLKFFTAFEGTSVDSIRATFGTGTNDKFADGVSGKAYQGDTAANIIYAAANDFGKSTSFTIAFWMKKRPHKDNAQFAFSLATSTDIWTKSDIFMLIENASQSSGDSLTAKFYLLDQWIEFTKDNTLKKDLRLPKGLDGNWHHLAFVYDESTSKLTTYWDGAPRADLPANRTDIVSAGKPRGPLKMNASKFIIGGPGAKALGSTPDGWMAQYDGQLDQFRMYGTALKADEIAAFYTSKK